MKEQTKWLDEEDPTVEISDLYGAEPEVAVVRMSEPDDPLWWQLVVDNAIERAHVYGLDLAQEDVTEDDCVTYDREKVLDWCHKHIHSPVWKWHSWEEDHDGDDWDIWVMARLETSLIPRLNWWRGAVVKKKERYV